MTLFRTVRALALLSLLSAPGLAASDLLVSPSGSVTLGGRSVQLRTAPQVSGETVLLPLQETAALLGRPAQVSGPLVQVGRLVVQLRTRSMTIDGVPYAGPLVITPGGEALVDAKLLAYALDGQVLVRPGGVAITGVPAGAAPATAAPAPPTPVPAPRSSPAPASAAQSTPGGVPEARFATNKAVYAPGERVTYTDFSFDPDGLNLARQWDGMNDVFFTPGEHRITLVVTNSKGRVSAPYARVIRVEGAPVNTPLSYALRYAPLGSTFQDTRNPAYPALLPTTRPGASYPLLFSDSPEAPSRSGVLYQDRASGRVRVVAYHLNRLGRPARLYVLARARSAGASVEVLREGSAGGTGIESVLGQVSVLDFMTGAGRAPQPLPAQGVTALYTSPPLAPEQGAKVLLDLQVSGDADLSVVMLEDGQPLTDETLRALPVLAPDAQHQRGTFPGAVRSLTVRLGAAPARVTLGDSQSDPALSGVDVLTGAPQRLSGNYGVQYDITVENTVPGTSTVATFVPRGGPYRGGLVVDDGADRQVLRIPGSGVLSNGDAPFVLWRTPSRAFQMSFIPTGGSFLPVSLVFYPHPGELRP
ncbi:hypothetical protein LAJ19_15410 (plasmid) [Deinococcus taeanensis]|uniref:hypothetical protein n=1 Tax=Deinococcus taeanensis TaxID=2737050 RepID=UPI001CDD7E54|nr:hypothetical protein [Deinococcus taeanensis]UBV44438.1 hypothetical protein LAJ19_15410 [Deinococcus taeanensis]